MSQTQAQLVGNVVTGAVFAGVVTSNSANIGDGVVGITSSGIYVTGVTTSLGGFVGDLTGTATNAQGLTGTPSINVGSITGSAATFSNLTVNGTQTIINTTSLEISDTTVGIAST